MWDFPEIREEVIDKDYVFTFGKYKGEDSKTIMQVDPNYFLYLYQNSDKRLSDQILRDAELNARKTIRSQL
jgi:hypothetical protein